MAMQFDPGQLAAVKRLVGMTYDPTSYDPGSHRPQTLEHQALVRAVEAGIVPRNLVAAVMLGAGPTTPVVETPSKADEVTVSTAQLQKQLTGAVWIGVFLGVAGTGITAGLAYAIGRAFRAGKGPRRNPRRRPTLSRPKR